VTPARVLVAGVLWRLFGRKASADTLLQAFSGASEQNRMLAGMSLVGAGRRSFELIENRVESGSVSPRLLRLLPDIDENRARRVIAPLAQGEGELGAVARDCLSTLDRIEADESQG
jgi:radical SAM superfamily enzyme with C-terminal helix-hairpin-helix motif